MGGGWLGVWQMLTIADDRGGLKTPNIICGQTLKPNKLGETTL